MSQEVHIHNTDLPAGWDEYVRNHPEGTWYHGSIWKEIVEKSFGHKSFYMSVTENNALAGVLPLNLVESRLFGKILISSAYARYGGVCSDNKIVGKKLFGRAKALAEELEVDYLEIRSVNPAEGSDTLKKSFRQTFLLELRDDFDEMWGAFRSEIRNRARKAEAAGCISRIYGQEAVDDLYYVFCRRMRELGTPVFGRALFENMADLYKEDVKIIVTRRDNKVIGAGIMVFFGNKVEVPWICSLGSEFKAYPNNSMYMEAIRYAIERGCKIFDFGTSTEGSGNARFKKRWGARPVQLNWEYVPVRKPGLPDLSPHNKKFSMAVSVWKKMPLWFTNMLGPVLMKWIP